MGEIKLNKNGSNDDFGVIPDAPKANDTKASAENVKESTSYIKKPEEDQGRKLFQNKKANIAFGILGAIIVVSIIAMAIFAYM